MKDLADKYGISSPYGNRSGGFHYGVDIPTPMRQPLYAPEAGTIAFEGDIPAPVAGYPKDRIIILQLSSSFLVFAHLDETVVNIGQTVNKNQLIGYTGNSGYSTGPHLHVEEHQGRKAANTGFLVYPSIDVTPRFKGQAQGGADDVTIDEFARIILDVIEDKPHYEEQQPDAFKGHVGWLYAEGQKDILNYRRWAKGIMANNGVLNATYMREHLKNDERSLALAQSQVKEVVKTVEVIKEVPVEVVKEVVKEVPVEVIKEVMTFMPPEAFSPLELIRIALKRWLGGDPK